MMDAWSVKEKQILVWEVKQMTCNFCMLLMCLHMSQCLLLLSTDDLTTTIYINCGSGWFGSHRLLLNLPSDDRQETDSIPRDDDRCSCLTLTHKHNMHNFSTHMSLNNPISPYPCAVHLYSSSESARTFCKQKQGFQIINLWICY